MSFNHTRHVKHTRRTRKCDWCWEPINAGDPSVVCTGTFDGDFFTSRYHPECDAVIPKWIRTYSDWNEALPEERMNRGGIEPYGEEEKP
jgi:hypothetical protein